MFIEQEEIDRLADEATLLHLIIGYPTLTVRKFPKLEPITEGEFIPPQKMETIEIQWHNLEFKYRKMLVEDYLKRRKDINRAYQHQIKQLKTQRNVAIFGTVAVFVAAVLIFGR